MAATLLELFVAGMRKNSRPVMVRDDRGGVNIDVARFMIEHPLRGVSRGSCISG